MGSSCWSKTAAGSSAAEQDNKRPVALIVWDIENTRLPHEVAPLAVLRALKRRFVQDAGFLEHKTVCCVTPFSLRAIQARWPTFLADLVPHMDVALAPVRQPKCSADYVLAREISAFCRSVPRSSGARLVLLTGDADFLGPVQGALAHGVDVRLVHPVCGGARALVSQVGPEARDEWEPFLAGLNGGAPVTLPPNLDGAELERRAAETRRAARGI